MPFWSRCPVPGNVYRLMERLRDEPGSALGSWCWLGCMAGKARAGGGEVYWCVSDGKPRLLSRAGFGCRPWVGERERAWVAQVIPGMECQRTGVDGEGCVGLVEWCVVSSLGYGRLLLPRSWMSTW